MPMPTSANDPSRAFRRQHAPCAECKRIAHLGYISVKRYVSRSIALARRIIPIGTYRLTASYIGSALICGGGSGCGKPVQGGEIRLSTAVQVTGHNFKTPRDVLILVTGAGLFFFSILCSQQDDRLANSAYPLIAVALAVRADLFDDGNKRPFMAQSARPPYRKICSYLRNPRLATRSAKIQ